VPSGAHALTAVAIDTAGADDIPRKRGLGIVQCDLLVINKVDLAPYVRVDVERMVREGSQVRQGRPILLTNCHSGAGLDAVVERIAADVLFDRS
jgi:urease accessory protein